MFRLERQYAEEMIAHARAEAPHECCGLLAGSQGRVKHLYRARNADHSPVRYSLDPKELFGYIRDIEDRDWDLLGIYHSHTHTEAYPSATDVKLAFWPDSLYFIISLERPEEPYIRAFRILEGKIGEEELRIE
ncbi:MAG: M67 family metallopeptidase [Dehalococcoidia bacterium]